MEDELARTSGSEFVPVNSEEHSDDDSSDDSYNRVNPKKNSRARNGQVAAEPFDDGDVVEDGNEGDLKGNSRSKGKLPLTREKKLGWENLNGEWTANWGEATDADFDAIKSAELPVEQREPPKELLMPLLPYQKEWLAWSMKQEAGPSKGGILADEMGMGKTIQAISLIVAHRALNQSQPNIDMNTSMASSSKAAQNASSDTKVLPQIEGTLVVCPLVAVSHWCNEISRFTLSGSVKVLVYHGPRRNIDMSEIAEYDVIVTTYSIVEVERRKHVMPPKEACKRCGKFFCTGRMTTHRRKCCGNLAANQANEQKLKTSEIFSDHSDNEDYLEDMEKGNTVAVDEVSEEDLKVQERGNSATTKKNTKKRKLRQQVNDLPNQGKSGRRKKIKADDLGNAMAGALESTEKRKVGQASSSVLYSVKWGRIILDEAHSVKDRRSSTAKAVFALQSEYKWALSGTPIQNSIDELYSLVIFLGVHPFSHYLCEYCECQSQEYPSTAPEEQCRCGHSRRQHFSWWNKFIVNPMKRWGAREQGQKAMMLLKHKVLSSILLRRTKLGRTSDLALPQRMTFLRRDAFDSREQDFYRALYTRSQSQFNTYVEAGSLLSNYAHMFALITRLRQAVNHPYLVIYSATTGKDTPLKSAAGDESCGLCLETPEDSVTSRCQHNFCRSCILGYIDATLGLPSLCPKCATPLAVDFAGKSSKDAEEAPATKTYKRSSILNRINLEEFQSSTKIEAVRAETVQMLQEDPSAKAIIFSQFTSMLDLIGFALEKSEIKFVLLDGSMSVTACDQAIDKFTNDAETKIFLLSLKAGGVALNLTVASRVFLMDPWWNPAVEQQAQARVHRLGQHRPVKVIRFMIENTIEERILKLQEKKQLVFEGTVGGSNEALGRLTEQDLHFLFGGWG